MLGSGHLGPQSRCGNECFIERCPACAENRFGAAEAVAGRCCISCPVFSRATVNVRASGLTK
jgi:hypothetical protein